MSDNKFSDTTRPIFSIFSWVRPMPRTRQVLFLGVVTYVSVMLFWSAYRINTSNSHSNSSLNDKNSEFQNSSIQIPSHLRIFEPKKSILKVIQDYPFGETRARKLECIGWRTIHECSFIGKIWSEGDQNCSEIISNDKVGYCEVEDVNSGEKFRVMRTQCNSLRHGVPFRCQDAQEFVNFRVQAHKIVQAAQNSSFMLPHVNITKEAHLRDGIVMVVYPKLLASAYATVRTLRDVLKCQLPIEIWLRPDEIKANDTRLEPLKHLAATEGNITFQKIYDPRAKQFVAKIHAIYHSKFDQMLFLDADNVPVCDPSFLFESAEFVKTGAIFWPDFWNPDRSIFGIHENSLLWEFLDMPFTDMFEQESGQLLIDRRRHAAPLELVRFYALHRPNFFTSLKLAWGDKDLFRLAWLKLDVPFTMIQTPPGMAGIISDGFFRSDFCGMTMVQYDANGEILFMHRNQQKLSGKVVERIEDTSSSKTTNDAVDADPATIEKYADSAIWTHILQFHKEFSRRNYYIDIFRLNFDFEANQRCYGQRGVYRNPYFYIQEVAALNFSRLESHLRHFALESVQFSSENHTLV